MASLRVRLPLLAVGAAALLAGCGSDALPTPTPSTTTSGGSTGASSAACASATSAPANADSFTDSVPLSTTLPDGLKYGDFTLGSGPAPSKGSNITVQYTGWLSNGTMFDTSKKPGATPFSFDIGTGAVIAGWDEGLLTMHVGGKRRLVIPPSLGYGAQANGSIPANSTLVFDVTLLSVGCPVP
jgi:peptidylprolyl isomerase